MNRAQRRHPSRSRKAALSLLVAGALAAGGASIAQAELAELTGNLTIQGGGGGAGGSSGYNGGGGGAYLSYWVDGSLVAWSFGGGGNGAQNAGSSGGSIGGGSVPYMYIDTPGGASGSFLADQGDGLAVADSTGQMGIASASSGSLPASLTMVSLQRGGDAWLTGTPPSHLRSGGYGGSATVYGSTLELNELTLISGEQGFDRYSYLGGLGGAVTLTVEELNAKTIVADQSYSGYTRSSGAVNLNTETLVAGLDYYLIASGSPTINIDAYEFDLAGASPSDILLTVEGWSLDPTLPITIYNTPESFAVGDSVILIRGIAEAPINPRKVTDGDYTFEVYAQYDYLLATVTSIKGEPPVTPEPDPEKPGVPPTGDGLFGALVTSIVMVAGAGSLVAVAKRTLKRNNG